MAIFHSRLEHPLGGHHFDRLGETDDNVVAFRIDVCRTSTAPFLSLPADSLMPTRFAALVYSALTVTIAFAWTPARAAEPKVDFNRDIRTILSNKCFTCHGPDTSERQSGLRLDTREGALSSGDSGAPAIVPQHPEKSELIRRITTEDNDLRMPPHDSGRNLTPQEVEQLTRWVAQGAPYARHWSYIPPQRPAVPQVAHPVWSQHPIDSFLYRRLQQAGLQPADAADRYALVRRLSLDLTGLPPTLDEVDQFVQDDDPRAYEKLVDRLLKKETFGEHWARKWLDLARYADSAGYADDPPRTIWAYRDYVIRSLNANKPFDQFTVEQIAGDLLPNPTDEQLVATAFHRNTLTNNEGGTNDEEFRNVAVVDRVNTTMAVWMGTTINCSQCHNHKYDPISQEEYFRFFAILNNTEDADRRNESPLHEVWAPEQQQRRTHLQQEIAQLESADTTPTPARRTALQTWESKLPDAPHWHTAQPTQATRKSGLAASIHPDGTVTALEAAATDVYTVQLNLGDLKHLTALRLEALPHKTVANQGPGHANGNFVITRIQAELQRPEGARPAGQFLRIENLGNNQILSLAEVQVFRDDQNIAPQGSATQSSTAFGGPAKLAIDGNTNGDYQKGTTTHTGTEANPWWEVDLKTAGPVDRITLWNRTDNNLHTRLSNFRISLLDANRSVVWQETVAQAPNPSGTYSPSGAVGVQFTLAQADAAQSGFEAAKVLATNKPNAEGWAIAPHFGKPHTLTLVTSSPVEVPPGSTLAVRIEQLSQHAKHTLAHFRLAVTEDPSAGTYGKFPADVLAALQTPTAKRTEQQTATLIAYHTGIANAQRLATAKKELADIKPMTTVPVLRELAANRKRKTHIQRRGNFLDQGAEVTAGLPAAFHAAPENPDRLALAKWLVADDNPLTARVIANRYWEAIFGVGIVRTSEEFGSQGELPSHPELLDWLATELVQSGWDTKHLIRQMVTSAAYQQSSRVTAQAYENDPDNRLLARGPRFRLSAEMIRDQALFVSGLLSSKMYGPPVKPPQPSIGLNAAFGGGIDWKTSAGEDSRRRGLYTTWRRSNPYPSMVAFDAPNREVCTLRRDRTNTPLQALVTLNDPVYIETAQALARKMAESGKQSKDVLQLGFRRCLSRPPTERELAALSRLYENTYQRLSETPEQAKTLATDPLGPVPENADVIRLAALTVVANVLLNTDEMIMKR